MYNGMNESLITGWNRLINASSKVAVTLGLQRRRDPVTTPNELRRFVEQRAKYMAQATLYGYLKTRAGTRYTSLFEDEVFVESINIAKWEIYLACLSDLTVYAIARIGRLADVPADELTKLADHVMTAILNEEEIPDGRQKSFETAHEAFHIRAGGTKWADIDDRETAFARSPRALIEWAPIAPQLKEFDTDIVINSMRFKWKHVRDELRQQMKPVELAEAWRTQAAAKDGS